MFFLSVLTCIEVHRILDSYQVWEPVIYQSDLVFDIWREITWLMADHYSVSNNHFSFIYYIALKWFVFEYAICARISIKKNLLSGIKNGLWILIWLFELIAHLIMYMLPILDLTAVVYNSNASCPQQNKVGRNLKNQLFNELDAHLQ